jgi:serine/threonine protein kinase
MPTENHEGCDHELIEAVVMGNVIYEQRSDQLIRHLNHCDRCRDQIDSLSSASQREASELLKQQPFDDESDSGADDSQAVSTGDATVSLPVPLSVRSVLNSLAPTDDPTMLGRLGGYEVSGVVGAGGMGVVLKALDRSLDRMVAIKVLAPHLAASGAARQRFAREAKAAAAVLHPNVIAIHGVSSGDEGSALPYLVMPYVRGSSLQTRIDAEGPLGVTEILRIAIQIVEGLAAAHSQGLVHRDIKPANILLEEGVERVSITDFGLARAVDDATLTHSGVIAGTPQYMSPEQARGEAIDSRSDLFSLGSVMYAMCAGRAPFRAETSYGILRRITDVSPRPIREVNPQIPGWLCRLVDRLHEKSPDDRYQSATAVARVLQQCLSHVQTPESRLPRELLRPTWLRLFSRRAGMFVVGAVLFALTITAVLYWPNEPSNSETAIDQDSADTEPATQTLQSTDWTDASEPTLQSVRSLIQTLDEETRRSFDEGP